MSRILLILLQIISLKSYASSCVDILEDNSIKIDTYTLGRIVGVSINHIAYDQGAIYGSYYAADISYPSDKNAHIVGIVFDSDDVKEKIHEYVYNYPYSIPDTFKAHGKVVIRFGVHMLLVERLIEKVHGRELNPDSPKVIKLF